MEKYIQLGDVRTWYEEVGTGKPLVMLHGGHTDARFFGPNIGPLAQRFNVFTPERRGHGHTPDVPGPFSYDLMYEETVAFLETGVGQPAHLIGHSDGAIVALLVGLRRPDLVRDLILVSGGFNKSGLLGADEAFDIDEIVRFAGPAYGEVSPDGAEHFRVVAQKTVDMAAEEPALDQSQLGGIRSRTLLMFGDDELMSLEHVAAMYDGIPRSELAIIPGTSHFLLQEKPELCNAVLLDFLTRDPVATIAPIRRPAAAR